MPVMVKKTKLNLLEHGHLGPHSLTHLNLSVLSGRLLYRMPVWGKWLTKHEGSTLLVLLSLPFYYFSFTSLKPFFN